MCNSAEAMFNKLIIITEIDKNWNRPIEFRLLELNGNVGVTDPAESYIIYFIAKILQELKRWLKGDKKAQYLSTFRPLREAEAVFITEISLAELPKAVDGSFFREFVRRQD